MKLSAYVATRNGATRNPPGTFAQLLARLCDLADEVVVAVDYSTTDDTFEVARGFTAAVYHFAHDPMWSEMRRQSFRRCTGDWIFAMDDDDRLSSAWSRDILDMLMASRPTTHYWIPSRYFVDGDSYLCIAPWIGHFSVQLYRNIESIASIPATLHYQLAIAGEPAYLSGLYVDAMDFVWHDKRYREAKIAAYDEAHDETVTQFDQSHFYVYEDYYFETRHPGIESAPAIMAPADDRDPGLRVRLIDCPPNMTVRQTYWITIRVINGTDRILLPQSEFIRWGKLAISYSWDPADAAAPVRTPFPARILPFHQHDALIKVTAPSESGRYRFRAEILEENHPIEGARFEETTVEIHQLVWPPKSKGTGTFG